MANKLTTCKVCGAEIAASAKRCPSCGAKIKKPVFRRWWFLALLLVVLVVIIASGGSNKDSSSAGNPPSSDNTQKEEPISYTHYNVAELFDALSDNALKAQDTYKGQYVEIEGFLSTIDSDGKYISIGADPDNLDYFLQSVQCFLKSDAQKAQIMEMSSGDPIVVRGKITSVGEVLGFSLDIDSIG
ncbi:MAG: hypothetical protein E7426_02925 [Ruminococcaceae bacterium]|nr:hypothetical protein [Oscillospiraceae bacterium]